MLALRQSVVPPSELHRKNFGLLTNPSHEYSGINMHERRCKSTYVFCTGTIKKITCYASHPEPYNTAQMRVRWWQRVV